MKKDLTIQLGKDVFAGVMPSLPVCYRLLAARRRAVGFTPSDEDVLRDYDFNDPEADPTTLGPSGEYNVEDLQAVAWAAVALSWVGELDCPTLRECGRDIVDYGEEAFGAFEERHRGDIADAGFRIIDHISAQLGGEEAAIEEQLDFSKAPEVGTTPGGAS